MRKKMDFLEERIEEYDSNYLKQAEGYAHGDEKYTFHCSVIDIFGEDLPSKLEITFTWNEIFLAACGSMFEPWSLNEIRGNLNNNLFAAKGVSVEDLDFRAVIIQLMALGLVTSRTSEFEGVYTSWILTPYGKRRIIESCAVKNKV